MGGPGMVPRSSSVEAVKAVETDSPAATAWTTFEDLNRREFIDSGHDASGRT